MSTNSFRLSTLGYTNNCLQNVTTGLLGDAPGAMNLMNKERAKEIAAFIDAATIRYAFISEHQAVHSVRPLCKMVGVHPSGYYACLINQESPNIKENKRLLGHNK